MITEKEYLEAKNIVEAYDEQLRIDNLVRSKRLEEEQCKIEEQCVKDGGHEYRPNTHKYGSPTAVQCIDCGKYID